MKPISMPTLVAASAAVFQPALHAQTKDEAATKVERVHLVTDHKNGRLLVTIDGKQVLVVDAPPSTFSDDEAFPTAHPGRSRNYLASSS